MPKTPITSARLQQLKEYQQQLDYTIEYLDSECWKISDLRKEISECHDAINICQYGCDGEPSDGTCDGTSLEYWELMETIIIYVVKSRRYYEITEGQLDWIADY